MGVRITMARNKCKNDKLLIKSLFPILPINTHPGQNFGP